MWKSDWSRDAPKGVINEIQKKDTHDLTKKIFQPGIGRRKEEKKEVLNMLKYALHWILNGPHFLFTKVSRCQASG
jgi:hypothetical protein